MLTRRGEDVHLVFPQTEEAWKIAIDSLGTELGQEPFRQVVFVIEGSPSPGNAQVAAFFRFLSWAESASVSVDMESVPESFFRLHRLATSVSVHEDTHRKEPESMARAAGLWTFEQLRGVREIATFTGDYVLALLRMLRGKAAFPWNEIWKIFKEVTVHALPIVSLISFLIGLIISFLGAVVLMQFGAEFAVSYLVGYGMLREMGAVMTGVIMAGRTGAAYAAQIGSMKVNEELDALETFGISSIDYIVLPRILALTIAMPLLTLYANIVGIFGGYLVADFMMGVPGPLFFQEMQSILSISDFLLGISKAFAFGLLIATAGCLRGLQSGRGASAVGEAATRAVVTGITLIIIANAVFDWAAATYGF